jgi:hypothetical protein
MSRLFCCQIKEKKKTFLVGSYAGAAFLLVQMRNFGFDARIQYYPQQKYKHKNLVNF